MTLSKKRTINHHILVEEKFHSNEEYEYDNDNMAKDLRKLAKEVERATIDIKNNAIEVVNTLEEIICNDIIRKEEIPLPLRLRLQRQDVTIEEKEISSHQGLWRQWLNIQRQDQSAQNVTRNFDQRIERRGTSIAIRINNLSLAKQGKRRAPQWKAH